MLLALLSNRRSFAALTAPTCSTKCLRIVERFPPFCNSIIRATIEKGSPTKALLAFESLHSSGALRPDHRTISLLLKASSISPHLYNVSELHGLIIKLGLQWHSALSSSLFLLYLSRNLLKQALQLLDDIFVQDTDPFYGNLLITSFSRKEDVESSYMVFKKMPVRDKISWNSMITAAVRSSRPKEALSLYKRMIVAGVEPDCFSFSTVLSACARAGALCHGERIHRLMTEKEAGFESNPFLCSALIDMYSKCGRVDLARSIFDSVNRITNSISIWNSMITGLAIHGLGADALQTFDNMPKHAIFPDKVTFVGILTACSHSGMVDEARFYFNSMQRDFFINPQLEHYGAMVDALARAGQLSDAYELIKEMPIEPDSAIWRALLGACRRLSRWDVAEMAMGEMKRCHSGDYVLLSNIYSSAKRWEKAEGVWRVMKERGVRKGKALSWVEMDGRVQQFKAGDRSHRNSDEIYRVLGELTRRAKAEGYVPVTEGTTKDVSDEEKEETLSSHSEKLAVAYCVMRNGAEGIHEIRVSKNLQTCWDCHGWMKAVCKVLGRVITVRDRIRFHRFENGECSCRDYW
ncbi:pentatricopeptide repeat-containing protein At5g50990 [Dendrobium catenatum]|uniref:Pentatricopeptide repeat-containing protein n=1 Tax=Dendrobium catenatum TaxID=906689 RepID=A0A2I0VIB6_9ASPA|nr:pentatricopeptide repeat-containing protein At5g50990 [Dendrobium catenatum]XP_020675609.1 pentatricopeptide repeat-containing protein At5g50990 [Dendrobium catenatum]XP_020675611.1 pentatricopeptide repeat-containing protein At5g50990 [Dendrobium catenatum]XP_020675612.1 pentatricopeptide repeat-containing protein At5g50990 [Dendrobium catenatum]XP_028557259.1 pentatricopeptide repeat-containing protein At5g50990 [Dendrobium catenatum]XP_028557260.1 pentatricopeptide repeat-containing prot